MVMQKTFHGRKDIEKKFGKMGRLNVFKFDPKIQLWVLSLKFRKMRFLATPMYSVFEDYVPIFLSHPDPKEQKGHPWTLPGNRMLNHFRLYIATYNLKFWLSPLNCFIIFAMCVLVKLNTLHWHSTWEYMRDLGWVHSHVLFLSDSLKCTHGLIKINDKYVEWHREFA